MFSIGRFLDRCREILAELDALAESAPNPEALEEMNAELEDALLLVSEIRPDDEDWREEMAGALEELEAIAADYAAQGAGDELAALGRRLGMAVRTAADDLD